MKISGNEEATSDTPVLFIGLADEHYQSLLPKSEKQVDENQVDNDSTDLNEMKACPVCGKDSSKVLWHLSRTKACKEAFGAEKLKKMVTESRKKNVKECVGKHREKRRAESPETFKKKIKLQVADHRQFARSKDEEAFKGKIRSQVAKWRKRENSQDRLKAFREGTLHGPDFICVSCAQRMFLTNVLLFDKFMETRSTVELEKFVSNSVFFGCGSIPRFFYLKKCPRSIGP